MAYFDFITGYISRLGAIAGCTEVEIIQLEKEYDVQLPAAYKEYLRLFGKNTGQLLQGYHTTADQIKRNIGCVEFDLVNTIHSNGFKVEPDMFFFAQWQGTVLYFRCDGNEDPPVYIIETFDDIILYKNSFTTFIKEEGLGISS